MKRDQKIKTTHQIVTDRINAVKGRLAQVNYFKKKLDGNSFSWYTSNGEDSKLEAKLEELRLLQTKLPKDKEYTIELHEWDWQCGDGCCTDYGLDTVINGIELEDQTMDRTIHLEEVLKHLGIKATVNWKES